jgi:transcriptional regulator with XRE-family HTH domain
MSEKTARRCVECGEPQQLTRKTVPYPESGLDNVQLLNVPVWVCPNRHEELEVPAVEELHNLLAHMIVRQPSPLSGRDIRFLRRRLGLTARDFSAQLGWTPEWHSQLENGHVVAPRTSDLLMKLACGTLLAKKTGKPSPDDLAPLVEELEAPWSVGSHRLRHIDQAPPDREWEEAQP